MKKNIAVIFGGMSNEHEVSRISAYNVLKNLSNEKYKIQIIGITKSGNFLNFCGCLENIRTSSWENHFLNKEIYFSSKKGIMVFENRALKSLKIDVVFPVVHGKNGEDGKLQALLELLKIPFVGCDSLSSANCMDKIMTNILLERAKINKANTYWFNYNEFSNEIVLEIENNLGDYPLFVKPSRSGSSFGVNKVKNRDELKKAIKIASKEDEKIVVQEYIVGKEFECAVLGNDNPIASVVGEVFLENGFYDYNSKYNNFTKLFIPARIDKNIAEKIRKTAILAYKTLGCSGFSRVDFFLRESDNEVIVNEINTIPGFTDASMYPKLIEKMGIKFPKLLDKLIDFAFEKHKISFNKENFV